MTINSNQGDPALLCEKNNNHSLPLDRVTPFQTSGNQDNQRGAVMVSVLLQVTAQEHVARADRVPLREAACTHDLLEDLNDAVS